MPNPRFDLMTLRVFAAVAELQSISKAARREHIAVSAVSKRVSDLEEVVGAKLLHRLPRGVEPTPAGSALLHHATIILRSLEQLEGDLSECARGVKGHVRMMVNEGVVQIWVTPKRRNPFTLRAPSISGVTWERHFLEPRQARRIPGAQCRVIRSILGHMAPMNPGDIPAVNAPLAELLADQVQAPQASGFSWSSAGLRRSLPEPWRGKKLKAALIPRPGGTSHRDAG